MHLYTSIICRLSLQQKQTTFDVSLGKVPWNFRRSLCRQFLCWGNLVQRLRRPLFLEHQPPNRLSIVFDSQNCSWQQILLALPPFIHDLSSSPHGHLIAYRINRNEHDEISVNLVNTLWLRVWNLPYGDPMFYIGVMGNSLVTVAGIPQMVRIHNSSNGHVFLIWK